MLNNTAIKKILKATIFKCLNTVNKAIPKEDKLILLYSGTMGIRHNLKPLRDKLVSEKYTYKYKVICGVESKRYYENEEYNLRYVTRLVAIIYFLRAKHIFYTAGQIPIKPSKNQIVVHMNHGTSDLKSMGALTHINNGDEFFFTYMLAPSALYVPIFSKEYLCPESSILICGEPMTDAFFNKTANYHLGDYDKIILWLPTFRQSSLLNYNDSSEEAIPMFKEEDFSELNQNLLKHNFKLIIKLHTAQNFNATHKYNYSNLTIYTNDEFVNLKYDLYELMTQVDILLGDYSSASLQFLLLNKPLAFVIPDIDEYKKNRGFCFDKPEDYMPGPFIKNKEQLYEYFDSLKKGIDPYVLMRRKVKNEIFKYQDGLNTKRVLEISNIYLD